MIRRTSPLPRAITALLVAAQLTTIGCSSEGDTPDATSPDVGTPMDAEVPDAALADAALADGGEGPDAAIADGGEGPDAAIEPLEALLAPIHEATGVPALAAWVGDATQTVAEGVVGVRKAGDPTPATRDDRWHLGSDTKAMTATLFARFVERGLLSWEMTMADALPELAASMHTTSSSVTITELLTMQGGFQDDDPAYESVEIPGFESMTPRAQRAAIAAAMLARPPASTPGTGHHYANLAYVLAGAILEARADAAWEDLLRDELFTPLGMDACGFGPPATLGEVDQPWPHTRVGGALVPLEGPSADNPAFLGPAGTVHCSLASWSRFAKLHLDGPRGRAPAWPPAVFDVMHTPAPGPERYAMGWGVLPLMRGTVLTHDGSNTLNYARILVFDDPETIFLITTNEGSAEHGVAAIDAVMEALLARFGASGWTPRGS